MHSKQFFTHLIGNIMTTRIDDADRGPVLFTCSPGKEPHFFIRRHSLIFRQKHQKDLVLFSDSTSPDKAQHLLNALTEALVRRQKTKLRRRNVFFGLGFLALLTMVGHRVLSETYTTTHVPLARADSASAPLLPEKHAIEKGLMQEPSPALTTLAHNLRDAAQRTIFTVPLTTGHSRTIYVFSDPLCPHCRDIEPTLEAIGKKVNIEIFPVSLRGKKETADQVIPVLCASPEHRQALWRSLFDEPSLTSPASCDIGEKALAVNDKAFSAYGFRGTPQLISDDGRPIPFSALKNEERLSIFMNDAHQQEKKDE
ncbi:thioredoxin fold domain-containing protein [Candidatus Williamhamiltonella defendens]|uniref:Conjugal transfer protein TrbB n=1 Tax=Candidatus Hamiltonella defensa (Bemisia tabaci) TaxID=672795 RepID=A0A249DZR1_9ENTR|nr:thioredoxin fold domain-containing protein [Candidatus Hamiltonella defensa]ASX26921.1 conjugal transfer protein TrbB [Candidatus Hamiltonella defensa (Bemisia tabaci)]CED79537.1 TrbB conjugal transfer protein [Candidatus Hamiltonella defensa (Bemisia tabaci)]